MVYRGVVVMLGATATGHHGAGRESNEMSCICKGSSLQRGGVSPGCHNADT